MTPSLSPEGYFLNALALYNLRDTEAAEKIARKGERLDLSRQFPQFHLILANILSLKQDNLGTIDEMRKYLKDAPNGEDAPMVRAKLEKKVNLAKADGK